MFLKYLLNGVKYFAIQLLIETFIVVILTYLGLPYSGMAIGSEPLWKVIIGTFGFYTFGKLVIFSWIYLPFFVGISAYKKYQSQLAFSVLNGLLYILLPLFFLCFLLVVYNRDLNFIDMLNPIIATILTSALIIITVKIMESRKKHQA